MMDDPIEQLAREGRLRELAVDIPRGLWTYRRSDVDGALILYAGDEPIAHIYAGVDLAKYLCELSPEKLFG